jgi:3-isopropylmalate dehydrogenase
MRLRITLLPGDGIGPEVIVESLRVLRAIESIHGHRFEIEERQIGGAAIREYGNPLPAATLDQCLAGDAVLLGAVGAPEFDALKPGERPEAGLLALRQGLGGYANLRPAIAYQAIADSSPLKSEVIAGADIMIVRELLGGLYFGEPRGFEGDGAGRAGYNTMRYSVDEVERVARTAFELARSRRRKVTSVDKANVLETSQLWRETVTRIAKDYPDVALDHLYVDACAMHLMTNPLRFDVIVTENLFGDILSDEAAVITGSLGMLASATIGGGVDLYEPVHGSAPDIAGLGVANPLGAIGSVAMMLRHTAKLEQEATDIEGSIRAVLDAGYRTADIARGGDGIVVSTQDMGEFVINALAEIVDMRHSYHAV